MSNRQTPANGHYSLASYRSEAEKKAKKAGGAFVLDVDENKSIEIPRPTGAQMFEAEEAIRGGSSRDLLEALCGDEIAAEVIELLGTEDKDVLTQFGQDLQKHFGLGE